MAPRATLLAAALFALGSPPAIVHAATFDQPAQPLAQALDQFTRQAGLQALASPELIRGRQARAISGARDVSEALEQMLDGTGLRGRIDGGTLLIEAAAGDGATALAPVTVTAAIDRSATTEHTGSYTTSAMNTATRLGLSIRQTPQSVSVVTRQQIEDQGLTSIESVLERSVGITQNKYESDRGDFSARGFTISKIQIDGLPSYASNSFDSDAFSDTALYDRVEIVRGATGLLAGTGDPSATVNLVRKRPTKDFQGYAQIGAGRWDTYRTEVDLSGPIAAEGKIRGRLVGAYADGKSFMENYQKDTSALYGILEADLPADAVLSIGVDYRKSHVNGATWYPPVPLFFSDGSRTDFSRSTSTGAKWAYINNESTSIFVGLEKQFANGWTTKLQYTDRDGKTRPKHMSTWGFPDRVTGGGMEADYQSQDSRRQQQALDIHAAGPFSLFGREHELVLGYARNASKTDTEWFYRHYGAPLGSFYDRHNFPEPHAGNGASTQQFEQRESAAYLTSRWNVTDPLKLIIGLRVTDAEQEIIADGVRTSARYRDELTPYAGVVYDISRNYSVYTSYTGIFKTQTARNRAGNLLDPVIGKNYEAGVKGEFYDGRLTVSAAAFKVKQDNLASFDAIVDGEARYKAINGATVQGYELEASGALTPDWDVSAGFTKRTMKNGNESYLETTQPEKLLRLSSSHRLPGALSRVMVGGHVTWQSRIYEKGTGPGGIDPVQNSYALLHLFASYQADDNLSFQLNINNVFDKKYLSGILGGYGRYGDPRNVYLRAKYRF
ncbi:TonB-dependent siderophore receptor [Pseudothauera nasutitermitis]|uniref:TonB-dependent siderophore receptor n=1 Tax=Pseudothauera nasutitermitis TaxID=2565930 RepID=A0A4S4B1D5_9RHOO|nr:TonB-dependent receptor [Pseudothauera nasutitermitis]THF66259.1 TonB-dependent siderophore receptor [Pseudothauera nasutitermitis]